MPVRSRTTASDGGSVVLLPGLLCDASVWEAPRAALRTDFDCQVPSYRTRDSISAMAQAVLAESPARFALIGHSMGGRVALEIARAAPERISALALLNTGYAARPAGTDGERELREREALVQLANEAGMRAMGRTWVQAMVHPARLADGPLIESILSMVERVSPESFAAQIRALLARPDASSVLAAIPCPTLLLCGREDQWSPLARHEYMARLIPHSELAVIEACGHMSPLERPAEVTRHLARWLAASLGR
jgi:pimeloyl-ACP methyl ester carboxylesterase